MKSLNTLNIEKIAAAIEADAGEALPGLRQSLAEAKAGSFAQIHTPEQIASQGRGHQVVISNFPPAQFQL